ncbi:MAG: glycosyltransferase family 4 protein, partial [Chthoniobacterales bacterium]
MRRPTYVFTNRVYPPVGGATGELLKELAEGLVSGGARVIVVTSLPEETKRPRDQGTAGGRRSETGDRRRVASQPTDKGLKDEEPETAAAVGDSASPARAGRGQTKGRDVVNGVEIIRVGAAPFTRASHWRRALSYLGLYPQLMWQVWKLGKVDAVVSMTDPPLQVAAVTIASRKGVKKVHWAQDVYPELAEELGVIPRGGLLARVLRVVSTWALRMQDEVVVVGRCMRERLIERGVDAGKIEVIPNWSSVKPVGAEQVTVMRRRLGWEGKFVVLYSGNIGLAHDFETLVDAARLLGGAGVELVFAGEGPRLEELRRDTAGLDHVRFLPPQPKEELSAFLAAADLHLVSVRAGLEGLVVPSKAYGILAAGRPLLYVGGPDAEVARVIAESGCGTVVPNGDPTGLAEAIKRAASRGRQPDAARATDFAATLAKWRE